MTLTVDLEHAPDRPGWGCSACPDEWPCEGAKRQLADLYATDPIALIIYLAERQWEAIDDATFHPDSAIKSVSRLRERFVGWTDAPRYGITS